MGEGSYEIDSSEGQFETEAGLQVTPQITHHCLASHPNQEERNSLLLSRMTSPSPLRPKSSYHEGNSKPTEEVTRVPLIQPPPPYCPLLPPGWKALAARAPASPYTVPFLLSPSGKRFFSVGEAVSHLVNPPKIEQQKMEIEMPMSERRRTRKMLTKRYPRTSLRRQTLMQNTERRALAEMDATEPFWDPSDVPPELNWDSSDVQQEHDWEPSDLPLVEPRSNTSDVLSEPYWDSLSFEIVLEGLNPLLNVKSLNNNNNSEQLKRTINS